MGLMFEPKIVRKKIFGINVDFEFDFYGPIFKTWQKAYEIRLWLFCHRDFDTTNFIKYALRYLPNRSYIILSFDETGNEFIQFAKKGTRIVLELPFYETNVYFGRKDDLIKIVKKAGVSGNSISVSKIGVFHTSLTIDFNAHNAIAAKVALKICDEIFNNRKPNLISYETRQFTNTF